MTDEHGPERHEPDWKELESATGEDPFMKHGFYLLREAACWIAYLAGSSPVDPTSRNEAIVRGLLVRLVKLMRSVLRDLKDNEHFQQLSTVREAVETVANLMYLLDDDGRGERFDKYVADSLVAEREFLGDIQREIDERGGIMLPIEDRIERSIKKTAAAAGVVDVAVLPARRTIGFGPVESRIKLMGPHAYAMYRMGSGEAHGTWTDLYRNHLTFDGCNFTVNLSPYEVRPQTPLSLSVLASKIVGDRIEQIIHNPTVVTTIAEALGDLTDRCARVGALHEQLLQRHQIAASEQAGS